MSEYKRECAYDENFDGDLIPICPKCNSSNIDLTNGDHGYTCLDCDETFIVP